MGHKDPETGGEIEASFSHCTVPAQMGCDCAMHTCMYMKNLVKRGNCEHISEIRALDEKLYKKRVKFAARILSELGSWKKPEQLPDSVSDLHIPDSDPVQGTNQLQDSVAKVVLPDSATDSVQENLGDPVDEELAEPLE